MLKPKKISCFWLKYFICAIFISVLLVFSDCFNSSTLAKIQDTNEDFWPQSRLQHLEQILESRSQELREEDALKKFQGKVVEKIDTGDTEKVIALTFDDGPDGKETLQILDILDRYKIKATFFIIGQNLQKYPYVARRIVRLGHAIGNHTWSHAYQTMSRETAAQEIEETAALIEQITGVRSVLFRPPLGRLDNGLASYAKEHNYILVLWSVNSEDAVGYPGIRTIAQNVIDRAYSGGIILLHDSPWWFRWKTVAALPTIIERLQAQGYRFVTLPELLALSQD